MKQAISFDFSKRANLSEFPELMDQPCSFEELRACLESIASVNRLTHAYAPTFHWLNYVLSRLPIQARPLHIVDVGCGYGDLLRRIAVWALDRKLPVRLTGIDLNADAVRAAREVTVPGTVTYLHGNAFDFRPAEGIDLIVSSLMTHHMQNQEIIDFVDWMESTARVGWFINDLHRQPVPYHFFRILSRLTTWHPFVKHDGPVSILRSFLPEEWVELCSAAGLVRETYAVREYWPARLCVARLR